MLFTINTFIKYRQMKHNIIFPLCIFLLLVSCSRDGDSGDPAPDPPTPDPPTSPVETNPANTNYPPAFTGQTRVNRVTTATSYRATVVTSSLTSPWGITSLPDGRLLLTEKQGQMRIVSTTGAVSTAITGLPSVNSAG